MTRFVLFFSLDSLTGNEQHNTTHVHAAPVAVMMRRKKKVISSLLSSLSADQEVDDFGATDFAVKSHTVRHGDDSWSTFRLL